MKNDTYITANDVLDRVQNARKEFRKRLTELMDKTDDRKLRIYLEKMCQREDTLDETITMYQQHSSDCKLDTWLQYGPEEERLELDAETDATNGVTVDEVESYIVAFENKVADYYAEAAEHVQVEDVHDLFAKLADKQREEAKSLKQASDTFLNRM